jgi:preprotein translocase subunit SecE
MNRQTKRMMQRQRQAERAPRAPRPVTAPERRKRATPRQFLREVRQELKKVAWPSRRELLAYTVVVLVSVVVLTSFVFGLDFLIARGVLLVFGGQGG